jgi:hypothetical protein
MCFYLLKHSSGEDTEANVEAEIIENVEKEESESKVEVQPEENDGEGPYVTCTDAYNLGDSINKFIDLANTLQD